MRIVTLILILNALIAFPTFAESSCEKSHKTALLKCKAYEHNITADQIRAVGEQTRVRVAEQETDKLFSMGKACANAQKECKKACSTNSEGNSKMEITQLIELQSNCAEGEVAEHRSNLTEKYLQMKAVLEESRTPASRK